MQPTRRGLIDTRPVHITAEEKAEPVEPWTPRELTTLWLALNGLRGMIGDCPARLWWLALHAVLYDAQCQPGLIVQCRERPPHAANGATWEDFQADALTLTIRPALYARRHELGVRRLDVTTVELLERMGPGPMFAFPGTRNSFHRAYHRITDAAGLTTDPQGRFARLRGAAPSLAAAAGQDVRYGDAGRLLGDFLADHAAAEGYGVARFGDFLQRPAELRYLTTDRLNRFVAWRLSGDVSSRTVENERKALKKLALAAAAKGYVEEPGKIERAVGAAP